MIVRTVFKPDDPREVDEAEAAVLRAQGLLLEEQTVPAVPPADEPPASTAPPAPVAKPAAGGTAPTQTTTPTKEAPDGSK